MSQDRPIFLLIDNDKNETEFISEIFKNNYKHCVLYNINNTSYLNSFLAKSDEYNLVRLPELIIYSTDSFNKDEYKIIEKLKNDSEFKFIPILILTKDDSTENINHYYNSYINACLIKPDNNEQFVALISSIINFWINIVKLPLSE